VGGGCLGAYIFGGIRGKVAQGQGHAGHRAFPGENAVFGGVNPGRVLGKIFVSGIRFFIGHAGDFVQIVHTFLLSIKQCNMRISTPHGVENVLSIVTELVVEHFDWICLGIKAEQQVLVMIPFHKTIIPGGFNCVTNISFRHTMLESQSGPAPPCLRRATHRTSERLPAVHPGTLFGMLSFFAP
jgi:hypothetical protein